MENLPLWLARIEKAVETTKRAGLNTLASFILGVPGETRAMIKDTIKFARKLNPKYAQFTLCTPYPGTRLFELAKEKGMLISSDWRRYTTVEPIMNIPGITAEELKKLINWAYISFYLRPSFVFSELINRRTFLVKKAISSVYTYYRTDRKVKKESL